MRLATIYFTSNLIAIFGGLPQKHLSLLRFLTQGIHINYVSHNFYDTNQLTSGATSVIQKTPKLQICDLPLSVTYFSVHELLEKSNVELTSKNMNEKIRHPDEKYTKRYKYYVYRSIPGWNYQHRINYCGGIRCKFFLGGQPKNRW